MRRREFLGGLLATVAATAVPLQLPIGRTPPKPPPMSATAAFVEYLDKRYRDGAVCVLGERGAERFLRRSKIMYRHFGSCGTIDPLQCAVAVGAIYSGKNFKELKAAYQFSEFVHSQAQFAETVSQAAEKLGSDLATEAVKEGLIA